MAKDAEVDSDNASSGNCEDETKKNSLSKNLNKADYQATNTKKGNIGAKKRNGNAKDFGYLIPDAKSTFN